MLYFNCINYFYNLFKNLFHLFTYRQQHKNKIVKIKLIHYTINIEKVDDVKFSIDNGPIYI